MKNSTLRSFFVEMLPILILLLMIPFIGFTQEIQVQTFAGLFGNIGSWVQDSFSGTLEKVIGGFIAGWLMKHGWTLAIKAFARKGAVVMKELGEFCGDSSTFLTVLDQAIKEDGSIKQNSVQEVLSAGKEVIGELKDVTISIKPK